MFSETDDVISDSMLRSLRKLVLMNRERGAAFQRASMLAEGAASVLFRELARRRIHHAHELEQCLPGDVRRSVDSGVPQPSSTDADYGRHDTSRRGDTAVNLEEIERGEQQLVQSCNELLGRDANATVDSLISRHAEAVARDIDAIRVLSETSSTK